MSFTKKTNIKSYLVNLDDYEIITEINRGTFGTVFLIKHKKDGHRIAAKVNIQHQTSTSEQDKYVSREIGILMRVKAPTIIPFLGFSLKDFDGKSNVTILMDYYSKGSLRQLIEAGDQGQSPHEYDDTVKQIILCGIAHGMMILHARRVLHRDLKPGNILLDENFHPYITDFGLSKFLDPENSKSQSTAGCGTDDYMSPEIINGIHYSTKSDVYSFGILMFEVLTGDFAFSELRKKKFTQYQIQHAVVNGQRPTFKVPIKPSFKKLIEQCWSQDPKERPTFRTIFHKLSLSLEDDDETIESSIKDVISNGEPGIAENDNNQYLLENADADQVLDYVWEITNQPTGKEAELQLLLEKQSSRIASLETLQQGHQTEITEFKEKMERNTQYIEQLKTEHKNEISQLLEKQSNLITSLETLQQGYQNELNEFKKIIEKVETENQHNTQYFKQMKLENEQFKNKIEKLKMDNQRSEMRIKQQIKEMQNNNERKIESELRKESKEDNRQIPRFFI